MSWNTVLGNLAACLFFVPPILILVSGLYRNPSLALLGSYFLLNAVYGLISLHYLPVGKPVATAYAAILNYIDTPIMLLVMVFFGRTRLQRLILWILTSLFLLYAVAVAWRVGLQRSGTVWISGPGLSLIFFVSVFFFLRQLRQTIQFAKGMGRTLIAAAIFFTYGCYAIIYCFYYLKEVSQVNDVFILYHFASIVLGLLVSAGLVHLARQHRKIEQLLIVRRELAQFY